MFTVSIIENVKKKRSQTQTESFVGATSRVSSSRQNELQQIAESVDGDRTRLLDVLLVAQKRKGYLPEAEAKFIAEQLKISPADVREVQSFYHFLHDRPAGRFRIFLDNSIVSEFSGMKSVRRAFCKALGIQVGETTADGLFGLYETSCLGLSDQGPAALINGVPFPRLKAKDVPTVVRDLKRGLKPAEIALPVKSHLRQLGPLFQDLKKQGAEFGQGLRVAREKSPAQICDEVKKSGLRGRGGAGFPTGVKWESCAKIAADRKFVVCNADEGEPGTFKDREILTSGAELVFEGMAIAGRAIGASEGIFYLRWEYQYLLSKLEKTIRSLARKSLLGDFSIRIQLGAGAYVCGEETALLESLEGKRGEPRLRPPFPVEVGYLGKPTVVNNPETYFLATKIMALGSQVFQSYGTERSRGTRLLSISGDIGRPGIYEVEWGITLDKVLKMCRAKNPNVIQVGGPSGHCVSYKDRHRILSFEDLPTGGSLMIFSKKRDLFEILENFLDFFVRESCGNCTPCRAGNVFLLDLVRRLRQGEPHPDDRQRILDWSQVISRTSRCGLGATSPNVLTTSLQAFRSEFDRVFKKAEGKQIYPFDEAAAIRPYDEGTRRRSL